MSILKSFQLFTLMLVCAFSTQAQNYMQSGVITYEVTTNLKKTFGNDSWIEQFKDKIPPLVVDYYTYTFDNNVGIYRFEKSAANKKAPEFLKLNDENSFWYQNFNTDVLAVHKEVFSSQINTIDSTGKLKWKLTNETRVIAGFNCRKAVTQIYDSVYVFAFYADEIEIPGGPQSINGLPGAILGMTIPRLYTSWIATKVEGSAAVDKKLLNTPAKLNEYKSGSQNLKSVLDATKDWWSGGDSEEEKKDMKDTKNRFVWGLLL